MHPRAAANTLLVCFAVFAIAMPAFVEALSPAPPHGSPRRPPAAAQSAIPTPESVLGFPVGADLELAKPEGDEGRRRR